MTENQFLENKDFKYNDDIRIKYIYIYTSIYGLTIAKLFSNFFNSYNIISHVINTMISFFPFFANYGSSVIKSY